MYKCVCVCTAKIRQRMGRPRNDLPMHMRAYMRFNTRTQITQYWVLHNTHLAPPPPRVAQSPLMCADVWPPPNYPRIRDGSVQSHLVFHWVGYLVGFTLGTFELSGAERRRDHNKRERFSVFFFGWPRDRAYMCVCVYALRVRVDDVDYAAKTTTATS